MIRPPDHGRPGRGGPSHGRLGISSASGRDESFGLTRTAQAATVLNLAFVLAAWLCSFGLPRALAAERAEGNT
jgi:hypothetical protein